MLLKLYANKFNNLDETGKVLEKHKLPKLTNEKLNLMSSLLPVKKLNFQLKTFLKTPAPDDLPSKFDPLKNK